MSKINIGCGRAKKEGYLNIDINPNVEPDLCVDIVHHLMEENSLDEVNADHFLEHLTAMRAELLLFRINRWLKINGKLKLELPNLEAAFNGYGKITFEHIMQKIYGDDSLINTEGGWQQHNWGYTPESIKKLLWDTGFRSIEIKDVGDMNMKVTARKVEL